MQKSTGLVDVGRIGAAYGVKGWVKVRSDTQPADNVFSYSPWYLKTRHGVKAVEVESYRAHGQGFVAQIKGVDDRDQAESLNRVLIAVDKAQLPELSEGEFYWHQLQGLKVFTDFGAEEVYLGVVSGLIETGANDVLVVKGDASSLDEQERLIPYVPGQYVMQVDVVDGRMTVDWDPEF